MCLFNHLQYFSQVGNVSNNVISNSRMGFCLDNSFGEQDDYYIPIVNNLFINDSILFRINNPDELNYNNFQYNACFNFDSTGNDTSYIGHLTQVNANDDSCDTGFNIFIDPGIVSLDSLDFHLHEDSPLINAGRPDSLFFDLDGTVNDIGYYGGQFGEVYDYPLGVGVSDIPVPDGFSLAPSFPNPFNSMTRFSYTLPSSGNIAIKIYDTIGRLVFAEKVGDLQAGDHNYVWRGVDNNNTELPTGIYYFELTFEGAKLVSRAVMLK